MVNLCPGLMVADVQRALGDVPEGCVRDRTLVPFYRIANNVWLLRTDAPLGDVAERVAPLAKPIGTYLLVEIHLAAGHEGFLPSDAWRWMKGLPLGPTEPPVAGATGS